MRLRHQAALLALVCCGAFAFGYEHIPNTLDEAYLSLDASLKPEGRLAFMQRPEREAVMEAHYAVGLYIRNQWLRSGKSALVKSLHEKGAQSFDDMSSMILHSYWRHLNGKPIQLNEQGACYRKWWSEQQKLIDQSKARGENFYSSPNFRCPALVPTTACQETWQFRPDETTHNISGSEESTSNYAVTDQPNENGFFLLDEPSHVSARVRGRLVWQSVMGK